jgi:hypothetical protein
MFVTQCTVTQKADAVKRNGKEKKKNFFISVLLFLPRFLWKKVFFLAKTEKKML